MKYDVDLSRLSVARYLTILKGQTLLPGRRMLLNNLDGNFEAIQRMGILNVAQLKSALSSPKKIDAFSQSSGVPKAYLVMLKRQIGGLSQKRVLLRDFPGIDTSLIQRLLQSGIKNSKDYFKSGPDASDELYCLCNLVRINGVGALAARVLFDAGYASVADIAQADAASALARMNDANDANGVYKVKLGIKDSRFCIDAAQLLLQLDG